MGHFLLLLIISGFAFGENAKSNSSPVKPNIRITTNAEKATIYVKQVELGQLSKTSFLATHIENGWNEISIQGDGFVERRVKVFITGSDLTDVFIEVGAQQTPNLSPKLINFANNQFQSIQRTPSHCLEIRRITPRSQREKLFCQPPNLFAELYNLGIGLTPGLSANEPSIRPLITEFKGLMRYSWQPSWQIKSEQIYAGIATNALGAEAAMVSSLWGDDCQRILSLAAETQKQGIFTPNMLLMNGICYQLGGKNQEAITNYISAIDQLKSAKNDFAISKIYWHLAMLQLPSSVDESIKILESCTLSNPWFKPCSQTLHDLYLSQGFLKKGVIFERTLTKETEKKLWPIMEKISEMLQKKQWGKINDVYQNLPQMSETFELRWLHILSLYSQGKDVNAEELYSASTSYVTSEKSANYIVNLITQTKNPGWIEQSLKSVTRDFPKNGYFWWRMGQLMFDQNRCREVVSSIGKIEVASKAHMGSISDLTGRCYIILKDFEKGLEKLKAFTSYAPRDWRSHSHLADGFARAGRVSEAISSYEEALSHNPPAKNVNEIRAKINELR